MVVTAPASVAVPPPLPPLQHHHHQSQQKQDGSSSTSRDQEGDPALRLNPSMETAAEDSDEGQKMKATLARAAKPSRIHIRFSDDPDAGRARSCVLGSTKPRQQATENGKERRSSTIAGNKGVEGGGSNSSVQAPIAEVQVVDVKTASMDNVPEAKAGVSFKSDFPC